VIENGYISGHGSEFGVFSNVKIYVGKDISKIYGIA
jgi:hypothetical protein